MDIELARTFLEISRCGSFVAAADALHVTQTAVTARIRTLEADIGCQLFVRNRSGARLTANGEAFRVFASQLVQTWERAKLDLPLPEGHSQTIAIGGETVLWNPLILNWITVLRNDLPNSAVQSYTGNASELYNRINAGEIDVAVVYRPEYLPQFHIKKLMTETLIQVTSPKHSDEYIFVDWGDEFKHLHHLAFPELANLALTFDYAPMALQYLYEHGGRGYFRESIVADAVLGKRLYRVPNAPEFSYPVYLVYRKANSSLLLDNAILALNKAIASI